MSFFPIPADKFGTKHKNEISLTNENKRARRERKHRAPTIKTVKKQRQIMDQIASQKIKDIQNVLKTFPTISIDFLAAKCTQEKIFDNAILAKMFIESFKERIFLKS